MIHTILPTLLNHVWQSTVVALVVWALTLALQRNRAAVRYRLWFLASIKFLLPFSLLIAAGQSIRFGVVSSTEESSKLTAAISRSVQPYPPRITTTHTDFQQQSAPSAAHILSMACICLWVLGTFFFATSWLRTWFVIRRIARESEPHGTLSGIPVLHSSANIEPGVFGICKPVLILPADLAIHLSAPEREMIFAHEVCHIRRRDNLTAAIHALVHALFWFHPLVWLIRIRLMEEREHACDEAVLASGSNADIYARSILDICRFYLEAPIGLIAGVTGGQLQKRVIRIANGLSQQSLSPSSKLLLTTLVLLALVLPFAAGVIDVGGVQAQNLTYDVSTIRPHNPSDAGVWWNQLPNGLRFTNVTIKGIIAHAWDVRSDQITGEPAWANDLRWDLIARDSEHNLESMSYPQRNEMLKALLADRLGLKLHPSSREGTVFHLLPGKHGLKLKPLTGQAVATDAGGLKPGNLSWDDSGSAVVVRAHAVSIDRLIRTVADDLHHTVIDQTGLPTSAVYDFELRWVPEGNTAQPADPNTPSISGALEEQLGLRVESGHGPLLVLVIDRIERPSAN